MAQVSLILKKDIKNFNLCLSDLCLPTIIDYRPDATNLGKNKQTPSFFAKKAFVEGGLETLQYSSWLQSFQVSKKKHFELRKQGNKSNKIRLRMWKK